MSENRMNVLMLFYIYKDLALNYDQVIDIFEVLITLANVYSL